MQGLDKARTNIRFNDKHFLRKLFVISVFTIFITLPWSVKANSFSIIVAIFLGLVLIVKDRITLDRDANFLVLTSIFYFSAYFFSLLYTENIKQGLFYLEKNFFFLFSPLIFYVLKKQDIKRVDLLNVYSLSVIISIMVCFVLAIKNNYEYNIEHGLYVFEFNKWFYSYHLLSENISIHPSYLACFISLAMIHIFVSNDKLTTGRLLIILFLFICLVQLSARSVLFSTFLFFLFLVFRKTYVTKNINHIWISLLALGLLILILSLNDISRTRILEMWDFNNPASNWGSASLRFKEWTASGEIIKNNPILGVGFGDVEKELIEVYDSRQWNDMVSAKYNSHNQILQIACGSGLLGVILFLLLLVVSVRKSLFAKDYPYAGFFLIFFVFSLTESTLEVQKGIVYFNLFNSMFYFIKGN